MTMSLILSGCSSLIDHEKVKGVVPRLYKDGIFTSTEKGISSNNFTGDGKFIYLDGKIYDGKFNRGLKEGIGKVISADGKTIYEGNWKKDDMSGSGKLYFDDGSHFKGDFKDSNPWNGMYMVKDGASGNIREGRFEIENLSGDQSLTKDIQDILNGAFGHLGMTSENPFTDRSIIEAFADYILSGHGEMQEYYADVNDRYEWYRLPGDEFDRYSMKYFGRKIDGNLYKDTYTHPDDAWGYYYEGPDYYFGFYETSWGEIELTVEDVYKVDVNTIYAVVNQKWHDYDDTYESDPQLIELEKRDNRYILKGTKSIKPGYSIDKGNMVNQDNILVYRKNDNTEFFLEQPKKDIILKNIKQVYKYMNPDDKNNDKVLDLIANDVNLFTQNLFTNSSEISEPTIVLNNESLVNFSGPIEEYKRDITNALKEVGIVLKRELDRNYVLNIPQYSHKDNFEIKLDQNILENLSHFDNIILNIEDFKIAFDARTLEQEIANGNLSIFVNKENNEVYNITFKDQNGQVKNTVLVKTFISIPYEIKNKNKSVYYTQSEGDIQDNIGGNYDLEFKAFEVETKSSGRFEIKDSKNKEFTDISKMDNETQVAIKSLVSKGIMKGRNETEFEPDKTITREEFTRAIVKTFYELDRSAKTTFTDVLEEDEYYSYIASSQKENIVKGYPDDTFKGKEDITKEDVISICARALHERKKYIYPENPKEIIRAKDRDSILDYAVKEVALAAREGIINNSKSKLNPQESVTRAEVAVMLERLIKKLY